MENNNLSEKKNDNEKRKIRIKTSGFSFSSFISLVAYIGIGCIAIALLFTLIFKNDSTVASAFKTVGEVIAYLISIILAYSWVKTHKHVAWIVCYVIFVVTIVILFILTI